MGCLNANFVSAVLKNYTKNSVEHYVLVTYPENLEFSVLRKRLCDKHNHILFPMQGASLTGGRLSYTFVFFEERLAHVVFIVPRHSDQFNFSRGIEALTVKTFVADQTSPYGRPWAELHKDLMSSAGFTTHQQLGYTTESSADTACFVERARMLWRRLTEPALQDL